MRVMVTERPSCQRGMVQVWSAHAGDNPKESDRSAEHAHAADRFAREISAILTDSIVRSRRLMGNPLGHNHQPCSSCRACLQYSSNRVAISVTEVVKCCGVNHAHSR